MKNHALLLPTIALVMLLSAQNSSAVEALSTKELAEHCIHYEEDQDGADAIFCVRYVQGFIDGAVATDETVMTNVAAEFEKEETYAERALRTRSSSRKSPRTADFYAEFCLGENISLKEVVEHVVEDLMNREVVQDTLLARDAVYAVLKRDYPCEAEDVK